MLVISNNMLIIPVIDIINFKNIQLPLLRFMRTLVILRDILTLMQQRPKEPLVTLMRSNFAYSTYKRFLDPPQKGNCFICLLKLGKYRVCFDEDVLITTQMSLTFINYISIILKYSKQIII